MAAFPPRSSGQGTRLGENGSEGIDDLVLENV
jgi:hypothetical protein